MKYFNIDNPQWSLTNLFWLLLAIAQTGCFSELEQPALNDTPVAYLNADPARHGAETDVQIEKWWTRYNNHELNQLLDFVLENSLTIKQAFFRVQQLQARHRIARSDLWPELSISATADRTKSENRNFSDSSFAFDNTTNNFRVSVPVSYEVDLWQRLGNTNDAAYKEALASKEDLLAASVSVAAEVVDTYFLIKELCEQVLLVDQTTAADKKTLKIVYRRYTDGVVTPLDVYQARATLASSNARKPDLVRSLMAAQHSLSVLLGEYPREKYQCSEEELPLEVPPLPVGIPAELLAKRPDLRASWLRVEASDANLAAAIANRFPSIRLTASTGYANGEISDLIRPDSVVWRLAAELGLTVIDFGGKRARAEAERATMKEFAVAYLETTLRAFKEVEDALVGEKTLAESIKLLAVKVEAIERTLRLSREQYIQGLIGYLPVLVETARYYEARRELIRAKRQLISNQVQLARALGGGWQSQEVWKVVENGSS